MIQNYFYNLVWQESFGYLYLFMVVYVSLSLLNKSDKVIMFIIKLGY